MCRSIEHAQNRVRLALRLADVLVARGIDLDAAEDFATGGTGRHIIAQLAHPGIPARKVEVPGDETWITAVEIARHAAARSDTATLHEIGVGR